MNNKPLVTVAVITYNSSKYVVETLESIKAQTYENIELIISDDKSTDNTVEICSNWLEKNAERFIRIQVIVPEKNTGQAGNCNRVLYASRGEWVKGIAGDDLLLPNCVTDLIAYADNNPEAKVIFGKMELFGGTKQTIDYFDRIFDYSFFEMSTDEQLKRLVYKGNCIPAPACIYNRQFIIENGIRNDERIPYMEDYPKWMNMLQHGIRFSFLDKNVVQYRLGEGISNSNGHSDKFFHSMCMTDILYRYPLIASFEGVPVENLIADRLVDMRREQIRILNSKRYKLGDSIISLINVFFNR